MESWTLDKLLRWKRCIEYQLFQKMTKLHELPSDVILHITTFLEDEHFMKFFVGWTKTPRLDALNVLQPRYDALTLWREIHRSFNRSIDWCFYSSHRTAVFANWSPFANPTRPVALLHWASTQPYMRVTVFQGVVREVVLSSHRQSCHEVRLSWHGVKEDATHHDRRVVHVPAIGQRIWIQPHMMDRVLTFDWDEYLNGRLQYMSNLYLSRKQAWDTRPRCEVATLARYVSSRLF